jgi:hypothetical protein
MLDAIPTSSAVRPCATEVELASQTTVSSERDKLVNRSFPAAKAHQHEQVDHGVGTLPPKWFDHYDDAVRCCGSTAPRKDLAGGGLDACSCCD